MQKKDVWGKKTLDVFRLTIHKYGMMTLLEEFDPYIAFQSQQPYDNTFCMR